MFRKSLIATASLVLLAAPALAQTTRRPSTTTTRPTTGTTSTTGTTGTTITTTTTTEETPATSSRTRRAGSTQTRATAGAEAQVRAAFDKIIEGIEQADAEQVMESYWSSPRLVIFNNNGTVTKTYDQVRSNRESSYGKVADVDIETRDVNVKMLGRDGAIVSALWTQSQTYNGTPETASGRLTMVFQRIGSEWKVVHSHTSPDAPDPSRIMPSERTTTTSSAERTETNRTEVVPGARPTTAAPPAARPTTTTRPAVRP